MMCSRPSSATTFSTCAYGVDPAPITRITARVRRASSAASAISATGGASSRIQSNEELTSSRNRSIRSDASALIGLASGGPAGNTHSSEETRETAASNPRDLYDEVSRAHAFAFAPERVRVAVNGALSSWERVLADGDEVVFLPPVSGG